MPQGILDLDLIAFPSETPGNEGGQFFNSVPVKRRYLKVEVLGEPCTSAQDKDCRTTHKADFGCNAGGENGFQYLVLKILPQEVSLEGSQVFRIKGFNLGDVKHGEQIPARIRCDG